LIISALLREDNHKINFLDANAQNMSFSVIENYVRETKPECIIFTFNSWIIDYDLKICSVIKKINPSCKTIGYSWYAENFSKEILTKYSLLDIQIIGDPFSVIPDLIKQLESQGNLKDIGGIAYRDKINQISINKKLEIKKKFKDLPLPAYDLIDSFKPYYLYSPLLKPYALIYAGKGCPYNCAYCPDANTQYSGRSAKDIIKEFELLKDLGNVKYVWFYDEVFTINRNRVIKVCNELIKKNLKIRWFCDSRVDLVDKKLLTLMKAAGCIGISYGVESGSPKILNSMKKSITIKQVKNALKWTREAGIPIQLNLILGYIGENDYTLKETENLVKITLPEILQISIILAMQGTEFSEIAIQNKWVCDNLTWQEKITDIRLDKNRYEPYNLNLQQEIKRLNKILYLNPKWWINNIKSLIKNYELILPVLGILSNRYKSISLF
jgi:radical SAM superfamily enzyme YgiQ (UPF0313 family)